MTPEAIRLAFVEACEAELAALKPGNVHVHAAGHGMTVEDFRGSARVASVPLCRESAPLGARILGAVEATRQAVGQNTNLGILLLCAPLAMAAERAWHPAAQPTPTDPAGTAPAPTPLARRLAAVLDAADAADAADARDVFRAIVLAAPGGLGSAAEHDVRHAPQASLDAAMAAAAGRDSIARQWTTRYADILGPGLHTLRAGLARWPDPADATASLFLHILAATPDSHVARRHGSAVADALRDEAAAMLRRLGPGGPLASREALLAWDAALKRRGLNPGTTADLTVATLFAHRLDRGSRSGSTMGCGREA